MEFHVTATPTLQLAVSKPLNGAAMPTSPLQQFQGQNGVGRCAFNLNAGYYSGISFFGSHLIIWNDINAPE